MIPAVRNGEGENLLRFLCDIFQLSLEMNTPLDIYFISRAVAYSIDINLRNGREK